MSDVVKDFTMTGLGPRTDRLVSYALEKALNDDVKNMITSKLVDPLTEYIFSTLRPYLIGACVAYVIVILLLAYIIYLLHRRRV